MAKETLILIVVVLALLGWFGWAVLTPTWDNFSAARTDLKYWQDKLAQAQAGKNQLTSQQAQYDSLKDEADKTALALPTEDNVPDLLVQLEALASQNGLVLNSVNFSQVQLYQKTDSAAPSATVPTEQAAPIINKTMVNLQLGGDFSALKNFLKSSENSLRLMDVSSLNFQNASTEGGGASTFSIGLVVYHC